MFERDFIMEYKKSVLTIKIKLKRGSADIFVYTSMQYVIINFVISDQDPQISEQLIFYLFDVFHNSFLQIKQNLNSIPLQ